MLLKSEPVPLYYQLNEVLRTQIQSGELAAGQSIPSERELCEQFGVSRATVRKALDALVQEGLLVREHGRGTFVAQPKVEQQFLGVRSFVKEMRLKGMNPEARILEVSQVPADPTIAALLQLTEGETIYKVIRLQLVNSIPWALVTIYLLPDCLAPRESGSTEERLGYWLDVGFEEESSWIDVSLEFGIANDAEARVLRIGRAAPVFLGQWTIHGENRPLEYCRLVYRADMTRFTLSVKSGRQVVFPSLALVDTARDDQQRLPTEDGMPDEPLGSRTEQTST